jgi:hypothetical protein
MAKDIKAKRTGETSASAAELYAFVNRVSGSGVRARATRVHPADHACNSMDCSMMQ